MTRALVLAGGRGTRLAPYTTVLPKPLMPVGEIPILEIVLRQLRHHGFREVIISVGHLAELIQAYISTRKAFDGLTIHYLHEDEPLGTAGPVSLLGDDDEDLLVLNGDILTTLDFADLVAAHRREQPALTVAVHARAVKIDLGIVAMDGASSITDYTEKPTLHYDISMGVYVYSRRAIKTLRPGVRMDFPELVLELLRQDQRVYGYRSSAYWLDIGRPDDYNQAVSDLETMRAELLPDEQP